VDRSRRHPARVAGDRSFVGDLRPSALDAADIRRRAAHVECDDVVPAERRPDGCCCNDTAGRAGEQDGSGERSSVESTDQATRRAHDGDGVCKSARMHTSLEPGEVVGDDRCEVCVEDGRGGSLELPELGNDVARQRYGSVRCKSRRLAPYRLFLRRVFVRAEQADGDGFDVDKVCICKIRDTIVSGDEWLRSIGERVVEARAILASNLDDILEPGGRDQQRLRPGSLEQCVRRCCCPMQKCVDAVGEFGRTLENGFALIGCRRELRRV